MRAALCGLAAVTLGSAEPLGWDFFSMQLKEQELMRELWRGDHAAYAATASPPPQYITQLQDHFDPQNQETWQQAYYVNDTFWRPGSDAPIFLSIGGEGGPMTGRSVAHFSLGSAWVAKKHALIFAVEHRYYGCHNASACPVRPVSNTSASLKYLSSRQAIEDLATFVRFINGKYGLTRNNKWIAVGGSYPGALASFVREKHPELIHASVANSASVLAQVNYPGYNDVVADAYALSYEDLGGSPACRDAIKDGHKAITVLFTTEEGRNKLASLFGSQSDPVGTSQSAEWYAKPENQARFVGHGAAWFATQSNHPGCTRPACDVKKICEVMTNLALGDEVHRLAEVVLAQRSWTKPKWMHPWGDPDEKWWWYWYYQTCTERGHYQTCEVGSRCMYGQGYNDVESMASNCEEKWGISMKQIERNIDASNIWSGGLHPNTTCVVYPSGDVDPWHATGILEQPGPKLPVLSVPGASHCAWMGEPDKPGPITVARQALRNQVDSFLYDTCEV